MTEHCHFLKKETEDPITYHAKMLEGELRRKYGADFIPFGYLQRQIECLDELYRSRQQNVIYKLSESGK